MNFCKDRHLIAAARFDGFISSWMKDVPQCQMMIGLNTECGRPAHQRDRQNRWRCPEHLQQEKQR